MLGTSVMKELINTFIPISPLHILQNEASEYLCSYIYNTSYLCLFSHSFFIYVQIKWSLREVSMIAFDHQKIVQ